MNLKCIIRKFWLELQMATIWNKIVRKIWQKYVCMCCWLLSKQIAKQKVLSLIHNICKSLVTMAVAIPAITILNNIIYPWSNKQYYWPRWRIQGAPPAPPLSDQIFSFLHTNFPECHRVGPWRLPYGVGTPPLWEILDPSLGLNRSHSQAIKLYIALQGNKLYIALNVCA